MSKLPENVQTVTITLDRPRTLAFTLGAMRRMKEAVGVDLNHMTDLAISVEDAGGFVWAMLINADREGVTRDDVDEMIHMGNLQEVTAALTSLIGETKGAEGNAPKPAKGPARSRKK